jgi:hypothetical protein
VFVGAEKAFMPQDAVYTRILGHLLSKIVQQYSETTTCLFVTAGSFPALVYALLAFGCMILHRDT